MEYELSDSSGTDDDLPPSHQNRFQRGMHPTGNTRLTSGSVPLLTKHTDMETQIHNIEQDAYSSVLRAFKAQSDAITWEKESLITELRKELRVSDEEHRVLLSSVNADDIIRQIREWRKSRGLQPGMLSTAQPIHEPASSPAVSASHKKQKNSQLGSSFSMGAPSAALHPSVEPSSAAFRRDLHSGERNKKPKSNSVQHPLSGVTGRTQVLNRSSPGAFVRGEPAETANYDPLIGKKVWTRWPEDNHFYEAVITDYNPVEGLHALVYDINTAGETWEWVNLKEISPEDIRWESEDPAISRRGSRPGPGRGIRKSTGRGAAVTGAGRGRGAMKGRSKKEFPLSQNGIGKKASGDIEILHTNAVIKEVEKAFDASHPDPVEIEKAKKLLKEHEQALVDAIARLEDASDGESADGEHPFPGHSMDQEQGWTKRPSNQEGEGRQLEGAVGNQVARDYQQEKIL